MALGGRLWMKMMGTPRRSCCVTIVWGGDNYIYSVHSLIHFIIIIILGSIPVIRGEKKRRETPSWSHTRKQVCVFK